jgi:hypothetical protein
MAVVTYEVVNYKQAAAKHKISARRLKTVRLHGKIVISHQVNSGLIVFLCCT